MLSKDPDLGTSLRGCVWLALLLLLATAGTVSAAPPDITAKFAISRSGLVLNRTTDTFDSVVTLRNTSGAPVSAPIVAAVQGLPASVALANKAGQALDGTPYFIPELASGRLDAGASISFVLKFANPKRVAFTTGLLISNGVDLPL
jgi:hypothetical protein